MEKILIICMAILMVIGGTSVLAQAREHEDVQRFQINQVPPAVQKVIEQEAAQHPLKSITMADEDGAKLYESTFKAGKQQVELKIAANGEVVSREIERNHKEDQEGKDD